jgi:hypothetical protein
LCRSSLTAKKSNAESLDIPNVSSLPFVLSDANCNYPHKLLAMADVLVVNELLCFLTTRFDKINSDELITLISDNYNQEEVVKAKLLLIAERKKVDLSNSIKSFTPSRIKDVKNKSVSDLVEIWKLVDREKGGNLDVKFVAADLNRVPSVNPEKYDLQFLVKEILSLKEKISSQNEIISIINGKLSTPVCACKTKSVEVTPAIVTPNVTKKRKLSSSAEHFVPEWNKSKRPNLNEPLSVMENAKSETFCKVVAAPSIAIFVKKNLSFSKTVENLTGDNRPWSLARALKKKKVTLITGRNESSALKGVKPEEKNYWDLSVTRLAPETTSDQVKEALEAQGIKVHDVSVFDSRIRGCKSAKVRVALEEKDKVKDEANWPTYVRIHDWVYKPRGDRSKPETSRDVKK